MKKADIILLAAVLFMAAAFFIMFRIPSGTEQNVVVKIQNEVVGSYPLCEDAEVQINCENGYNIMVIENGKVYVKEANCRNQICVNTHPIGQTGEMIVCMPHEMLFVITQ